MENSSQGDVIKPQIIQIFRLKEGSDFNIVPGLEKTGLRGDLTWSSKGFSILGERASKILIILNK